MLKLLLGNPWVLGIVALALVAAGGGIYVKGRMDGGAICDARWLKKDRARVEREMEIAEKRDARILMDTATRIGEIAELTKKVEEYEAELATRSDPGCILSPADAKRLRDIR